MNEYDKQAIEFLNKTNSQIKIEFLKYGNNPLWDTEETLRKVYTFTITTPRGSYTSKFYGSINEYEEEQRILFAIQLKSNPIKKPVNKVSHMYKYVDLGLSKLKLQKELEENKPTAYSILACLTTYNPGTLEEFCSEYGYDEDSRKAEKTYNAVIQEYLALSRIFTNEELQELGEIL